jgi:hypothetical protein
MVYLHHVLAELAFGPRPEGKLVCHIDDDGLNPYPSNLYYGTKSTNGHDAVANGRLNVPTGDNNWGTKLTDAQMEEVRTAAHSATIKEVAARYRLSESYVLAIKHGQTPRQLRSADLA